MRTTKPDSAPLLFTLSGLRGIVGRSLFPTTVMDYALAFGSWCKGGKVVLSRDTRASGEMLKMVAASALVSTGCQVIDIGITPTPTVGLAVINTEAKGGLTVTASHNPIEWNALKFFNHKGRYLAPEEIEQIKRILEKKAFWHQPWNKLGTVENDNSQIRKHIAKILKLRSIKLEKIRKARFKVVLDGCNGAGFQAGPGLLKALGCKTVGINCENTGTFPRKPEPVVANLGQLEQAVRTAKADIGFALDPDADRLAIVSDQGKAIGEEYTLALAVDYLLSQKVGKVVVNLSTSRMVEEVAKKYGCQVERTKVGEANVSALLERIGGVIGGEGNGGVILPQLHHTRDGLLAMALILSYLAESGRSISSWVAEIPKYYMEKKAAQTDGDLISTAGRLRRAFRPVRVLTLDGIKLEFADSWLHLRKSNTEPIVRIIAEARSKQEASGLTEKALKIIRQG
ncbi:MAG: phosphoglucosamine mutase [candidate division Zixibacteria bacterium RBG_16_50_21]|nr:MAG: phosphoglucosamine mutase [candidate division Zixibacteria bacterium RBG_16_50_21]